MQVIDFIRVFNNSEVLHRRAGPTSSNLARRLLELRAGVLLVNSLILRYGGNLFNIVHIDEDEE